MSRRNRNILITIFTAAVIVYVARAPEEKSTAPPAEGPAPGERAILHAFENQLSSLWVEADGTVDRILSDDTEGARHQRFILRLPSDHTVLVSHNIDLAPRVPDLTEGERIAFRGEYEWNERGGVIHWTHHDPDGRKPGGWLERSGRRFE